MEVSREDRSLAMVAHGIGLLVPALGPAAMFFASRKKSRFVAVHALHSALVSTILNVVMLVLITIAMYRTLDAIAMYEPEVIENIDLMQVLARFHSGLVIFGLYTLAHIASTIYHIVLANKGISVEGDAIGRLACKMARF